MPQLIALAPLLTAAAAATGAGVSIYSAMNQPGAPKGPTPAQTTQNAIASESANRASAAKAAGQLLPGLQANTSGGLSPDAYQTLSADFSGNADLSKSPQFKELIDKFLGTGGSSFGGSGSFGDFGTSNPASPGLAG